MNYQEPATVTSHRLSERAISPGHRRRVVLVVGLIAVALFAGLVAFQMVRQSAARARLSANRPPSLAVGYEVLKAESLAQTLSAVGSLAAINRATLSVEAGGTVTRIAFKPGAHVKQGDLLVQLNDSAEQADLANFRAQQRLAKVGLDRANQLALTGNAARAQLDQMQSQTDVAVAGIARAESAIAKKTLRAPFAGDLGLNLVDVGEFVNPGTAVAQITDKSRLYLHFTLPEQTRPQIAIGQNVSFTLDAYPDVSFTAKIAVIDPEVEESTRAIHVHGIAENPDGRIMPGMFATVLVDIGAIPDTLTVPETAISYSLTGNAVFVAVPDKPGPDGAMTMKAKKVMVRTGAAINGRVVVLKGLAVGDQVVTTGQIKLFDGSPITLKQDSMLAIPAKIPRT
jgi:multidrug efflux system membrane fusion protein